jgi:hypothetical protein
MIGQSPRPDLAEPLQKELPQFEPIQIGALEPTPAQQAVRCWEIWDTPTGVRWTRNLEKLW